MTKALPPKPEKQSPAPHRKGWSRWLLAALAIGGLVFAALHFGKLEQFAEIARHARPLWLLAGVALQLITYAAVAWGWRAVLRRAGAPQSFRRLLGLSVAKLYADQVIPGAGMGGNVLLADRLEQLGVERPTAVAAVLLSVIGYYVAYAAMALLMLLVLALHRQATPLFVGLVAALLVIALVVPGLALWLRRRGRHDLPHWLERIGPLRDLLQAMGEAPRHLIADRQLIATLSGCYALVFLADSATLMVCLRAIGQPLLPASSFIAMIAASIAATLALIPMGLGSFEATSTATLRVLGVAVAPALTATLLARSLTLWLPLLPAVLLLHLGAARHKRR